MEVENRSPLKVPNGGFLKCWYPTTMGFPTKNDHFGVFWEYHHLRKHPNQDVKFEKFQCHWMLFTTAPWAPQSLLDKPCHTSSHLSINFGLQIWIDLGREMPSSA